ncbi:hypothetical protein M9458_026216 [Cirrhinus mrigala]|uniref:Uncharacterized protein n=1 Tax=Cirrhinus mrigala TaxID=683832 RepID=A0ABD0PTU3_CIRMR
MFHAPVIHSAAPSQSPDTADGSGQNSRLAPLFVSSATLDTFSRDPKPSSVTQSLTLWHSGMTPSRIV